MGCRLHSGGLDARGCGVKQVEVSALAVDRHEALGTGGGYYDVVMVPWTGYMDVLYVD